MKSQPKRAFHTASEPDIKAGEVSDVYFARTVEILAREGRQQAGQGRDPAQELPADRLDLRRPRGHRGGGRAAGGPARRRVGHGRGHPLRSRRQPVLVIEGIYLEWAKYETALLGFLCQASGIATKAARCKRAAGERQVISFGARRMHPALAPMIERNAFVGGCDGVAVTKSAELIDADPTGHHPALAGAALRRHGGGAARPSTTSSTPRCGGSRSSTRCRTRSSRRIRVAEALGRISTRCASTRRRRGAATSSRSSRRCAGSSTCAASTTSRSWPRAASTSTRSSG